MSEQCPECKKNVVDIIDCCLCCYYCKKSMLTMEDYRLNSGAHYVCKVAAGIPPDLIFSN
uniref:Uncharacterized protein n=1 Tax=viral metagenome TaxID=1070528 RepID=A0A6C0BQE5_9ZZZZ